MLEAYGRVGFLLILAVLFPLAAILGSFFFGLVKLRPHKPNRVKSDTYECGMTTVGHAWGQFNFRYYLFALMFVLFDVEAVFLYPWAVAFRQVKLFGFIEAVIFVLILLVGYTYAWRKKALEWS